MQFTVAFASLQWNYDGWLICYRTLWIGVQRMVFLRVVTETLGLLESLPVCGVDLPESVDTCTVISRTRQRILTVLWDESCPYAFQEFTCRRGPYIWWVNPTINFS